MNLLLIFPITIPLLTAILSALAWRSLKVQRALGVLGSAGLLAAALALLMNVWRGGIQSVQMGSWPAPFGITLVADLFGAIMVALAALTGFAVLLYSLGSIDERRQSFGYFPLFQVLLMGVCGAFLTGDLFNLYVWFEVLLIASFVLMALGGERGQMEGAVKYVTLNLVSSALFLAGIGILYGKTGTLNMADLAQKLRLEPQSDLVNSTSMLFLIAFGIKAGAFPFFFWLPASYHTPPVAVSAVFAGLLTKVGVYALIRCFTLFFVQDVQFTHTLILALAGLTMVTGVLGAAAQNEIRRILSFHIISQIGYMLMGLGLMTPLALAGSVFYLIHHIIVKTNLFLIGGVVQTLKGSDDLKKIGGLYKAHPLLALLFAIPAFSLAGIPPLSGFFAKLTLIIAGLKIDSYLIVLTALAVGILTLFSMTKIWNEAFWKAQPAGPALDNPAAATVTGGAFRLLLPVILLAAITVLIGAASEPFFALATRAAEQLIHPEEYIRAVLGGKP
ncbi:MAG: Na+/H+ antiporter subunit D [Calditrichaceae bacterium]|nr:Na+/H+ antiporter subunit D [Calditrichia bacterium]NUQ41174.1 Na+/H+ antiporter subunit D [Calditrichaceae bacterium]